MKNALFFLAGALFCLFAMNFPGWAFVVGVFSIFISVTVSSSSWAYDRQHSNS